MDYYSVLGVSKTASQDEIKRAYRKQAMAYHPDREGGDEAKFKQIQEAYDVLGDEDKRHQYDNPRSHGSSFSFDSSYDPVFEDIMSQFFRQAHGRQSKQTYRTNVTISLIDAYKGSEQMLQMSTPAGNKVINISIPRGINSGDQIRYDNVIDNATLLVQFIILPDLRFERRGNDLFSNHPISVLDLIVGTKFKFTTIDQRTLEVKVAQKSQPFMHLRIPGAGMPDNMGKFGDQIILLKPFMPDTINQQVIDAITSTTTDTQGVNH